MISVGEQEGMKSNLSKLKYSIKNSTRSEDISKYLDISKANRPMD